MFKSIETKKFIALFMTVVFGILSAVAYIKGKGIPSDFVTVYGMIVAFYFGVGKGIDTQK